MSCFRQWNRMLGHAAYGHAALSRYAGQQQQFVSMTRVVTSIALVRAGSSCRWQMVGRKISVCRYSQQTNPSEGQSVDVNKRHGINDEAAADRQKRTPQQREGSRLTLMDGDWSEGETRKGKLLTTPSRLLKLILPVTTHDYQDGDRKGSRQLYKQVRKLMGAGIEPLALLVHPQQPLSYLERLIQAEVPLVKDERGQLKPPTVSFLAMELSGDAIQPRHRQHQGSEPEETSDRERDKDSVREASTSITGEFPIKMRGGPGEGGVEMYGNLEKSVPGELKKGRFVRWSSSTEIGDFIRDAARAKEFIVLIEGSPLGAIPVGVPSFDDRTYYLRMRLRKLSRKLRDLAVIKHECDVLAHRGAQRVAIGGLGVIMLWWYLVYKLTFETDLGWDTMEPITYLVSLSTLMAGYAWFLYHNREISYRSALDFTVNRRQQKLYQMKGVDLRLWESLLEEANALRKEIKTVAEEYDVDWDETLDEQDVRVTEALKHERRHRRDRQEGDRHGEHEDTHHG